MIRPQEFERRRFAKMKFIIDLIFILLLLGVVAYVNEVEANTGDAERVGAYVSDFLKNAPQRRARALELVPVVVAESRAKDFDPMLIAVMISLESSWKVNVTGGIGEVGLLQVVPGGVCAKGQDLTTGEGQIRAGINCLKLSRDACGDDLEQILTMYASGRCVSKSKRTKRMIEKRIRIYRGVKNGTKEN